MKNLTKALAVVIALTMVLGTVAFANFSDVTTGSAYAEAIEVGVALNLFLGYEDGTFKPEGDITRAEFAAIVVRALGQESQADGAKGGTKFVDVPADHWAAGYVNLASNQGIIAGYGDGNFGPEDKVTYEQAVKMLVVALGYEPAVGSAGYPVGYLTIANQRGITTGVNGKNGVAANRGQVAQLVFNSLDVPLMVQSGFGNYIEYIVEDGNRNESPYRKTLLSESFSVAKLRVNVLKNLGLTSTKNAGMVEVRVDRDFSSKFASKTYYNEEYAESDTKTVKLAVGTTDILSMIGARANVYVLIDETNENDDTVLYASRYVSSGNLVETTSALLETVKAEPSTGTPDYYTVEYYETDSASKVTKISLVAKPNVYVNGQKFDLPTDVDAIKTYISTNKFGGFYGSISFSDDGASKDTKGDYNTVFINDYKTMIVDEVNTSSGRVTGDGTVQSIRFGSKNTDFNSKLIDKDGKELEWSSLQQNDVLAVQEIKDTVTTVVATLVTDTVTGKISEYDSVDKEYSIGGKFYKKSPASSDSFELGDSGIFYLDIMGAIVKLELEDSTSRNYAYILAAGLTSGLDSGAQIRFYTAQGEIVTFDVATNVTVENYPAKAARDTVPAINILPGATVGSDLKAVYPVEPGKDVVVFTLNSSGKISKLTYPKTDNSDSGFRQFAAGSSAEYNYKSESMRINDTTSKRVYIDSSTIIMQVGKVIEDGGNYKYDDDDFELISLAAANDDIDIKANATNSNKVFAFDVNKNNVAKAIVIIGEVDLSSLENGIAMFIKQATTTNTAGDRVARASVLQDSLKNDNKAIDLLASSDLGETLDLKLADVFTTKLNAKGEIRKDGILKIASVGTNTAVVSDELHVIKKDNVSTGHYSDTADTVSKVDYALYNVIERSGSRITIKNANVTNAAEDTIVIPAKANVYVYRADGPSAADRKVYATEDRTNEFYSQVDKVNGVDTTVVYDNYDNDPAKVQLLVREYEGDIVDVIIYIF